MHNPLANRHILGIAHSRVAACRGDMPGIVFPFRIIFDIALFATLASHPGEIMVAMLLRKSSEHHVCISPVANVISGPEMAGEPRWFRVRISAYGEQY